METTSGIVGRRAERDSLHERRELTLGGEPSAVLLTGDAGVGKSTLLAAACRDAEREGWQVHVGHCVELAGGALPLGPVAEILRHLVADRGREWLARAAGPLEVALAPLVAAGGIAEASDRPGVLAALVAVVEALGAERPTLLAVEDVHWADRSTLDALDLVVRTTTGVPVLVVATLRADELHRRHPTRTWAAELSRHPRVTRLDLQPFGLDDLAAFVARLDGVAPDQRFLHELYARTDGNAFFVESLLAAPRGGRDRLPERLSDVLLARIDGLDPPARRVLDVAATAARGIDHRLLAAVAGLDPPTLRDGVRQTIDAGLLVRTDDGSGYRLRHALLREVAHDELLPGDREELHRELATALMAQPELALSPSGPHGELAHHWEQARDHARTYTASLEAAREARSMAAYAESLQHVERALALYDVVDEEIRSAGPRRDRLLHEAGVAAFTAGVRGTTLLRAAADEARRVDAPVGDVLQSLLRLAYAEWANQHGDTAIRVAEEAVALVENADPALLVHALGELARLQALVGRQSLARPLATRAVALAAGVVAPLGESVARNSLAVILAGDGDVEEAVTQLRIALRLARQAGEHVEIGRAVVNLTDVLTLAGRPDEAEQALDELTASVVHPEGLAGHLAFARLNVASGLLDDLRIADAARHIDAVRVTGQYGVVRQFALRAQAALALHRGEIAGARQIAARARAGLAEPLPDLQDAAPLFDIAVWAALLDDDPAGAYEASSWLLGRADEWAGSTLHPSWQLGVRAAVALALAARAAGDASAADAAGVRAHEWAARGEREASGRPASTPPGWQTRIAATRAVLARLDGAAAQVWEEVGPDLDGVRGLWRIQIAVEAAVDLRSTGRIERARAVLDDAADDLGRLPATHPLARTAGDIRAGLEPTVEMLLTPREQEVLTLVALGRTNREIGEQLFVSEKTASVHVSNILRKLEVGNRVEAAAAARRLGLD